jgi:c-di-GMP-binding flagellar brake protein YcgR
MKDMRKIFFPAQKVDILIDDFETGKKRIYNSRIEDVQENGLVIAAPYSQGYFLPPRPGRDMHARVTANGCAYLFVVKLQKYVHAPIELWTIAWPTDVERVQLRSYVRFDVNLDVHLTFAHEDHQQPYVTITKDISAGGLGVMMASPPPAGTQMDIVLYLEEDNAVEAQGEIIRVIPPDEEHEKSSVAIRYVQMDEKDRVRVIRFIFKKQIERRKKHQEIFEE